MVSDGNRYGDEDNLISPWLHFQGLGIGPNIPVYLRVNGNVCNLNFSKKECEIYVNDIWVAKAEFEEGLRRKNKAGRGEEAGDEADEEEEFADSKRSNKVHLSDFFKIFLEVSARQLVALWADTSRGCVSCHKTCVFSAFSSTSASSR